MNEVEKDNFIKLFNEYYSLKTKLESIGQIAERVYKSGDRSEHNLAIIDILNLIDMVE